MKNLKSLRGVAAALFLFAVCIAPALAADSDLTYGDFLVKFATMHQLKVSSAIEAKAAFADIGVAVPNIEFGKPCTQGDVVATAAAAGIGITSSTPEAAFGTDELIGFENALIGNTLPGNEKNATRDDEHAADPLTKGKGLKKGLYKKSPSEPI